MRLALTLLLMALLPGFVSAQSTATCRLDWDPSTTPNITEYRIYVAATAADVKKNPTAPALKLGPTIKTTTCDSAGLSVGKFAGVTAVLGLQESLLSNIVQRVDVKTVTNVKIIVEVTVP